MKCYLAFFCALCLSAAAATAAGPPNILLIAVDDLREVALLRMQGESLEEISARLGYVSRSVKRKLELIRELWERELDG